jgi:purine-binding chemotaxis protein CheW
MMGVVVDEVSEVLNISAEEIEEVPAFGDRVCTDYMKGIAKVKGTVKILLDLDRVLGTEDAALRAA